MSKNTITEAVQARLDSIRAERVKLNEAKTLRMLDSKAGQDLALHKEDAKVLDAIIAQIETAYDKEVRYGFRFDSNIEKIIAIVNHLQYAKADVRELLKLTPEDVQAGKLDLYDIFDSNIRNMVLESYGSLPYFREVTTLVMPDGEVRELDAERVKQAEQGVPTNLALLNVAVTNIALTLGLMLDYEATETQQATAWNNAVAKLNQSKQLNELQGALSR